MTTALSVASDQQAWDGAQLAALKQLGLSDAPQGDLALFLHYSQRTGLDPFSRQIYMIGRWDSRSGGNRYTIQSSIDGLRIIAQRSGEYAGQTEPKWCGEDGVWQDVWLHSTPPLAAKVGVYRQGFAEPLIAVATLNSYMPAGKDGKPQGLWAKMPDVMLAKVAEALALRKAFPNDLSGIYTSEEMDQADARIIEPAQKPNAAPIEAEIVREMDDETRASVLEQISKAETKDDLREIWKDNASILELRWKNTLDEWVTFKEIILAKQASMPEPKADK